MRRGQPSTISKDLQQIIAPACIRSSRDAGWQGFALASLVQPAYEQEMKGFPGCVLALHRRSNNPRFKPHHVSRLENSRHEGALMGGDMMIIPPHQPCFGVSDKPLACIAFTLDEAYYNPWPSETAISLRIMLKCAPWLIRLTQCWNICS
jgi:hypothetical protein